MNTPLILRNLAYKLHREERITDDVRDYINDFANSLVPEPEPIRKEGLILPDTVERMADEIAAKHYSRAVNGFDFNDAIAAMTEYASQETAALRARVTELEIENGKLKSAAKLGLDSAKTRGEHAEMLMGLLEDIIKRSPMPELDWQSYCREHNLKPTTNGTR